MNINQRVVKLIDKVSGSKKEFSEKTGISPVILSHISSGRNKVSLTAVEQILMAYQNVNSEWLVLGRGEIFKDGLDQSKISAFILKIEAIETKLLHQRKSVDSNIQELKQLIKDGAN